MISVALGSDGGNVKDLVAPVLTHGLGSQEQYVDIDPKTDVIREIPAGVVRIFVERTISSESHCQPSQ